MLILQNWLLLNIQITKFIQKRLPEKPIHLEHSNYSCHLPPCFLGPSPSGHGAHHHLSPSSLFTLFSAYSLVIMNFFQLLHCIRFIVRSNLCFYYSPGLRCILSFLTFLGIHKTLKLFCHFTNSFLTLYPISLPF